MISHPTAAELIEAVSRWIGEVRPQLDERNRFLARVASNALGIAARELALGEGAARASGERLAALLGSAGPHDALVGDLCERLRDGRLDAGSPGLLAALRADLLDQLAIDQPGYRHGA